MAAETASTHSIVPAARARRAQLMQRVAMACMICLAMSQLIGWAFPIAWLAIYGIAQVIETSILAPAYESDEPLKPWRVGAGLVAMLFNASSFGALTIDLWLQGGPYGGVCAMMMLAAAAINAVVSSPGSRQVLVFALAPQAAYMFAGAWYMQFLGAPAKFEIAVGLSAAAFCAYAVMLWRNLEQRRLAEEAARADALRKQAEAEAATAAKSVYVATIGHELRTPISAMLAGAIELERAAKGSALRPHAALIADAGRMMKTLLDDVLDHAKLEAGRMSIETVTFDLRGLLSQTARFWQSEARKKGLRLRVEGSAHLPRWVAGDPTRLRQILNNLISNAVKFTETGSVTLNLKAWGADDDACAVRLQVIDTGAGMEPGQVRSLFNAFQQADKSVARNYGGTGLGLVISRQLARLMGGQLTAASRKGSGSTFTLALTLDMAEAPAVTATLDAETPIPSAEARSIRVLVADDHEINRRAVQLVLQPAGASIVMVADGRQAFEAAQHEAFDVIVMDVRMPEMDGREATRMIRSTPGPNQNTPVIAVTAEAEAQPCFDAGMNYFVPKPIDPAKLMAVVIEALQAANPVEEDEADDGRAVA